MDVKFRTAVRGDVPQIVALLRADSLGVGRETVTLAEYSAAFQRVQDDPNCEVIVGEIAGSVVATYHINILHGLSRGGTTRAQIEAVRVDAGMRGERVGQAMMVDAETRAWAAGASMMQLTSDCSRVDAQRFYESVGFTASHIGFKRSLSSGE